MSAKNKKRPFRYCLPKAIVSVLKSLLNISATFPLNVNLPSNTNKAVNICQEPKKGLSRAGLLGDFGLFLRYPCLSTEDNRKKGNC